MNNRKMGTIRIELDLPDFRKEIELRVLINKDGVQECTPPIKVNNSEVGSTAVSIPCELTARNMDVLHTTNEANVAKTSTIPSSMMSTY